MNAAPPARLPIVPPTVPALHPIPKPDAIQHLLTVAQAAEWLGVRVDTVRGWIKHGELEAFDVGTKKKPAYRVPVKVVLARFRLAG